MVRISSKHSRKMPVPQAWPELSKKPHKISASTQYNFRGKDLTPYGGLFPVATMLEKLGFKQLVNDTLRFYRDLLGMKVTGESENYGTEQEYLNNVFGAHLRITSLRSASGPGVELLEYLSPRDGTPFPLDEHANDVIHRQTVLVTESADQRSEYVLG